MELNLNLPENLVYILQGLWQQIRGIQTVCEKNKSGKNDSVPAYINGFNANQRQAHTTTQEKNCSTRFYEWKEFLPLYFSYMKHNYAHCSSYCTEVLDLFDFLYTGVHSALSRDVSSVLEKTINELLNCDRPAW